MKREQETVYDPDRGTVDKRAYCAQVERRQGYYGPWRQLE